jgi:hypothetical protein
MTDYLMYWKYFWQDMQEHPDSFNDKWHTRNESFFNQVERGNSLWVVVSGGLRYPEEWRLLQRIVVAEKFVNYDYERPYGILGDPGKGQKFDIEAQTDLTPLLHKLEFVSGRRITAKGRGIGNALQTIRPLSESDTALLKQYANTLGRHWSDAGFNDALKEKLRVGAGFGNPETNRKVERAAVSFVTQWYKSLGWKVESVEAQKRGYDLLCAKGYAEEHVEVKGVQADLPAFIITAGEVREAQNNSKFVICVVTSALKNSPKLFRYVGKEFVDKFELAPLAFRAILRE